MGMTEQPTGKKAPLLILGLGNTLLSDDGIAIYAVRELQKCTAGAEGIHFEETSEAGLALLDLLVGYDTVWILDALPVKAEPYGAVHEIPADEWDDSPLASSPHYTGLPSLLQMGRKLGYYMPSQVRVFAITVKDPFSVREELTPELQTALPAIVQTFLDLLNNHRRDSR
ncbi:MAG TPA: hydrogenase maturation protease [Bacteroidetes bacterium]|nr:hydrogenase maturation protease [Bacteroidota bacterium]